LNACLRCSLPVALLLAALSCAFASHAKEDSGRQLVLDKNKGNCADCHQFPNDPLIETRATVGPPLSGITARFASRPALANLLKDPMALNPDTVMPPFGRHRILTEREIDAIVDYLYTQ
jgi:sulfur-oxidizing protein SoxX